MRSSVAGLLGMGQALLADGRTAMPLMALGRPRRGETVLVEPAAGGVGTLLVQAAVSAGARRRALGWHSEAGSGS